jgi:hypothetical protein
VNICRTGKILTRSQKVKSFQYFPPGNHRANRAERYIRTWKNHFIATLAMTSPNFPMVGWHKLILLAELTLHCLLPWQPNPEISAYHGLTGSNIEPPPLSPLTRRWTQRTPQPRAAAPGHLTYYICTVTYDSDTTPNHLPRLHR